ncbi:hypothetical protein LPJ57_004314 [Coemansia sp. RSA 486]|nr:hypothetical protein LPJ57_004314 [Coemansia sp. RSA 486]
MALSVWFHRLLSRPMERGHHLRCHRLRVLSLHHRRHICHHHLRHHICHLLCLHHRHRLRCESEHSLRVHRSPLIEDHSIATVALSLDTIEIRLVELAIVTATSVVTAVVVAAVVATAVAMAGRNHQDLRLPQTIEVTQDITSTIRAIGAITGRRTEIAMVDPGATQTTLLLQPILQARVDINGQRSEAVFYVLNLLPSTMEDGLAITKSTTTSLALRN